MRPAVIGAALPRTIARSSPIHGRIVTKMVMCFACRLAIVPESRANLK
jgi:hypothetical protein